MLPRKARLRRSRDFRAVYSRARSYKTPLLVLYARPARPSGAAGEKNEKPEPLAVRIGFSISKKVAKKAHDRNLLKRRLREITRTTILPEWRGGRSFDVVVVARQAALEADYAGLLDEMLSLFLQAGLLKAQETANPGP